MYPDHAFIALIALKYGMGGRGAEAYLSPQGHGIHKKKAYQDQ